MNILTKIVITLMLLIPLSAKAQLPVAEIITGNKATAAHYAILAVSVLGNHKVSVSVNTLYTLSGIESNYGKNTLPPKITICKKRKRDNRRICKKVRSTTALGHMQITKPTRRLLLKANPWVKGYTGHLQDYILAGIYVNDIKELYLSKRIRKINNSTIYLGYLLGPYDAARILKAGNKAVRHYVSHRSYLNNRNLLKHKKRALLKIIDKKVKRYSLW